MVSTKQKKSHHNRDKKEKKEVEEDYLFYDLGEQGDVNVLDAQPVKSLGLIKKKKNDTKNMLIKSKLLFSLTFLYTPNTHY